MKRLIGILIALMLIGSPTFGGGGLNPPVLEDVDDSVETNNIADNAVNEDKISDALLGTITSNSTNSLLNSFYIQVNKASAIGAYQDGFTDEFEDESGVDTGASLVSYDETDDYYDASYITEEEFTTITDNTADEPEGWLGDLGGVYNSKVSQGFKLSNARDIKQIQVYIKRFISPDDITVRIETDNAGDSSGTLADANLTGTIRFTNVSTTVYGWIKCTFASAGSLPANTQYHLVSQLPADPGTNEGYHFGGDIGNNYPDGVYAYYDGSWTTPTFFKDGAFKIEYFITTATLISNSVTATSVPTDANVVFWGDKGDGDIVVSVSRDDGATYSEVTESEVGAESGSIKVYQGEVDISGQPSDTDMLMKAVLTGTARLYAWGVLWR